MRVLKNRSADADISPMDRRRVHDAAVALSLPWLGWSLSALFGVLGLAYLTVNRDAGLAALVPLAWTIAVAGGALSWAARTGRVPDGKAHLLLTGLVALSGLLSLSHLALTDNARTSTDLMLTMVGAGVGLVSVRWVVGCLTGLWAGWLLVISQLPVPDGGWAHWVLALLSASFLAIIVSVVRRRGVDALAQALDAAEQAAVRDPLTGLTNRRGLMLLAAPVLDAARRRGDAVHCLFVDIDGLKHVNDTLGHRSGDEVLLAVAEALASVTRGSDIVARWGGDEFCVVGPGPGMPPTDLERRVHEHVALVPPVPEDVWPPAVTVGAAMLTPWEDGGINELLGSADQEMYRRRSLRRTSRHRVGPDPGPPTAPPVEPSVPHPEG